MNLGKIIASLYQIARLLNDFSAITSGDPVKMIRRGRNKYLGRRIGRGSKW